MELATPPTASLNKSNVDNLSTTNTFKVLRDVAYIFLFLITIGTIGFRYFANLDWVDAFQTCVFYVTGLGSVTSMPTSAAKIWSALFAIIASTIFIGIAANIVADIVENKFIRLE